VKNRTLTLEQTNERLAQANQKLQQASARQLQHFACMSHEIRTPLVSFANFDAVLVLLRNNG
jgi:signal transduction histidine kinase